MQVEAWGEGLLSGRDARSRHEHHFRVEVKGNTLSEPHANAEVFHTKRYRDGPCSGKTASSKALEASFVSFLTFFGRRRLRHLGTLHRAGRAAIQYGQMEPGQRKSWTEIPGFPQPTDGRYLLSHTEIHFLYHVFEERHDEVYLVSWCDVCESCRKALETRCHGQIYTSTFVTSEGDLSLQTDFRAGSRQPSELYCCLRLRPHRNRRCEDASAATPEIGERKKKKKNSGGGWEKVERSTTTKPSIPSAKKFLRKSELAGNSFSALIPATKSQAIMHSSAAEMKARKKVSKLKELMPIRTLTLEQFEEMFEKDDEEVRDEARKLFMKQMEYKKK